jgi:hypothetical protein
MFCKTNFFSQINMSFCNQGFTYHDVQDLKYWKLFSTNHLNRSQQFQYDSNILKQNPINKNISLLNSLCQNTLIALTLIILFEMLKKKKFQRTKICEQKFKIF